MTDREMERPEAEDSVAEGSVAEGSAAKGPAAESPSVESRSAESRPAEPRSADGPRAEWPEVEQPEAEQPAAPPPGAPPPDAPPAPAPPGAAPRPGRRPSLTRVLTALLLALLGFAIVVQVRNVSTDPELAALGQEDLVRILANLDAHEERLREEIGELEESKRRLTTAGQSQQEAREEAERRADELGILAGTLPAHGPGLVVKFHGGPEAVSAARLLDAVQELRGAGAEAMQIAGGNGPVVRVATSTYFVDNGGGITIDGQDLTGPYTLTVIGDPETLAPALNLPGGVVESVRQGDGTVSVQEEPGGVEVTALRAPVALQHARPAS